MKILAPTEKARLDLYHLARLVLPRLSEKEDFCVSASLAVTDGEAKAEVALSTGNTEVKGAFSAPLARHFSAARAASAAPAGAFFRAAKEIGGISPPYGTLTGVKPVKVPLFYLQNGASFEETRAILETDYFVAPDKARLLCGLAEEEKRLPSMENDALFYLSIPFCPSRCAYCSFISSSAPKHLALIPEYLAAMEREIALLGEALQSRGKRVRAVYTGGGTPGILSASQLDRLLCVTEKALGDLSGAEQTVELGRPETVTAEKLDILASHGVRRICVNPQSTSDEVLRRAGRGHTRADFFGAMELVKKKGGFSVNCDLIAGLPGDDAEGFLQSVSEVLSLSPESVTVHALCKKNAAALPSAEEFPGQTEAVREAHEACIKAGLSPYYLYRQKNASAGLENLGLARPGEASLYNLAMMEDLCDVYAAGAGAVTKIVPPSGRIRRFSSFKYPYEYLASFDRVTENAARIRAAGDEGR